jgi:hypothetical protein
VTYPSIGNFTRSKKNYTFGGQRSENKPSEPKNGTKAPKTEQRPQKRNKGPKKSTIKFRTKKKKQKVHDTNRKFEDNLIFFF